MFKTVHGIHWQCFVIRKIYGFDNCSSPVRSVTKKIDEVIYFTIAGKFNGDFFPFTVFAVNLMGTVTDELIQEADGSLSNVVAVRYDIVYLAHMVQVFYQTYIQPVRDFHIEFLDGTERLQSDHLAHKLDVLGRDRFGEQFAFVAILTFGELCYQHFHFNTSVFVFAFFGQQAEVHRTVEIKRLFCRSAEVNGTKPKSLLYRRAKWLTGSKRAEQGATLLGSRMVSMGVFSNDFAAVDIREELC